VAGIGGSDYADPRAFAAGFRTAMLVCAGLLVAGSVLAALLIRRPLGAGPGAAGTGEPAPPVSRIRVEECLNCGVAGPPVHPRSG
jgi:hypothetical protein